jgi:hypothetical protein
MVADHLLVVTGHEHSPLRYSITRLSMPLFFVVSGHLFRRLRWRHAGIAGVGLALPLVVPWVDNPNVLVTYVAGAVLLSWFAQCPFPRLGRVLPYLLVGLALTVHANRFPGVWSGSDSYEPLCLFALMALGRLLPLEALSGLRLPAWLGWAGRWPLSVYVGHLLLLELAVVAL